MTTTDQAWAPGANTQMPAVDPAPPPPTHLSPCSEGEQPARWRRWVVVAAAIAVVAGAGVGGWVLRGVTTSEPIAEPRPIAEPGPTAAGLSSAEARKQTCDAYAALGTQWSQAYQAWLPAVSGVNWHWNDSAVADATKVFSQTQTQIVIQLRTLIAPNTPTDVSNAVNDYASAILSLGAALGNASGADTNGRIDAIDAASAAADKICDF